uniref:laccase domain-containing protein n=1 Tax=Acinetobacter baumannii TaxID=470 RepID=UPI00313877B2
MPSFVLPAQWPASPRIHALTTLRHGLGVSPAPFDSLNLGNRSSPQGDLPANVERNRALLTQALGLPGAPH